jgi:hypothetical protein
LCEPGMPGKYKDDVDLTPGDGRGWGAAATTEGRERIEPLPTHVVEARILRARILLEKFPACQSPLTKLVGAPRASSRTARSDDADGDAVCAGGSG